MNYLHLPSYEGDSVLFTCLHPSLLNKYIFCSFLNPISAFKFLEEKPMSSFGVVNEKMSILQQDPQHSLLALCGNNYTRGVINFCIITQGLFCSGESRGRSTDLSSESSDTTLKCVGWGTSTEEGLWILISTSKRKSLL